MVAQVNSVHAFSHNHIKITTKLQNNHHLELPATSLNRSPITRDLKKKPHLDCRRGRDFNGMVPHEHAVGNNWEGFLSCSNPPRGVRDLSLTPGTPAQGSTARKRGPHSFWL